MPHDPRRVQSVFLKAAELPQAERPALLDGECGDNGELRHAVESLLAAHDRSGTFLDEPIGQLDTRVLPPHAHGHATEFSAGAQVGPYKLVQKLGEGGMGAVWAAEQDKPVRRRVAVKLIKPGMDSAQVLRRFEAERQALALMDHINIAKILDAGVDSARGCPYFVLELVKGVPITTYCDELHLTIRERLELFVPVCRAVQHAHQKGIVHRDLKPANVLVCIQDGKPVPKVIDFGVAKALHQQLTDESIYTAIGAVIGTLQYMSPEQAELGPLDVDTRADVYALGVLLYELLTGTTPLDPKRLREAAFVETLRAIREEEPTRPSTRLTDSAESLAGVAALRKTNAAHLAREVSGDLDWIVMRCLEKDRTRRYDTANGLARDVERYLTDEAIEARPPSAGYRVRKFVRRNRRGVIAAGAVLAALVLGVIGTTLGMMWALNERDAKEGARREAVANEEKAVANEGRAVGAANLASRRLGQMERTTDAVTSVFDNLDLYTVEKQGKSLKAALSEQLDRVSAELDADTVSEPVTVARLRHKLGKALLSLGSPDKAIPILVKALQVREAVLGPTAGPTLATMNTLTQAYLDADRRKEALPLARVTLERQKATFGIGNRETLNTMMVLAELTFRPDEPGEHVERFRGIHDLAVKHLGPGDKLTLAALGNLASAYHQAGRSAEAIPMHQEVIERQSHLLSPTHPIVLLAQMNLGAAYVGANRIPEGIEQYRKALALQKEHLPANHPYTLTTLSNLGHAYYRSKRYDEAAPIFDEVLALRRQKHGPDHSLTLSSLHNVAAVNIALKRWPAAIDADVQRHTLIRAKHGPDHRDTAEAALGLGRVYVMAGEPEKGLPHIQEGLRVYRSAYGANTTRFAALLSDVGWFYLEWGRLADAEPVLRDCLTIRKAKDAEAWTTAQTRWQLGKSLADRKQFEAAEEYLVQGYEGMRGHMGKLSQPVKSQMPVAADYMIRLYDEWGKPEKAAEWRARRAEYLDVAPPPREKP